MSKRIISLALLLFSVGIRAEEAHTRVDLVPVQRWVQPDQIFQAAARFKMDKGWHIYWKNPGESGLPTEIHWKLPRGFRAGALQYPYPERIAAPPVVSYGYSDEAVFFTEITPAAGLKPGDVVTLRAEAKWMECDDVCIPRKKNLVLHLPVKNGGDVALPTEISQAAAKIPFPAPLNGFRAAMNSKFLRLEGRPFKINTSMNKFEFFPENQGIIDTAAEPRFSFSSENYVLEMPRASLSQPPPARLRGVAVFSNENGATAFDVDVPLLPASTKNSGIAAILFFAFLGGMLLNVMPCVLPVLSLKILGFMAEEKRRRRAGLVKSGLYALGVIASFWALAGALLILRAGGKQLGWGFQMQSPEFVAAMALLFFLLGLNLLGVFEIGTSFIGLGGKLTGQSGNVGAFFSGVLAVLVATPCTAPFMGTALGFALTQPPAAALAAFTALGAGMAFPYVLLSFFPRFLGFLPKPGPWMENLKQLMGFLLIATVVWLAWVVGRQRGADGLTTLLGGLWAVGLGAWVWGKWVRPDKDFFERNVYALFAVLIMAAGSLFSIRGAAGPSSSEDIVWEKFSPARLEELRKERVPVFVDFTAAWCLSCQVNERVALRDAAVVKKIKEKGITPLKADWTNYDPAITEALQSFGRDGVPLYVLYDTDGETEILPALLTPQILLDAFEKIKSKENRP